MNEVIYIDTPLGAGDTMAPRKKPCPRCNVHRIPHGWDSCDSCSEDELRESCGFAPKQDVRCGATHDEVKRVLKSMAEYVPPPKVVVDLGIDFSTPESPPRQQIKPPTHKPSFLTEEHRKKIAKGMCEAKSKAVIGRVCGAFRVIKDLGILPSKLRMVEAVCTNCGELRVRTVCALKKSKGCRSCGNKPTNN